MKKLDLAAARRRGIQEGLLGGNNKWLAIGGAAWAIRAVQWAMARPERVIYRGRLEPGETLVIDAQSPRRFRVRRSARADVAAPLRAGERVLLIDTKARRYLVELAEGGEFHSHKGIVPHAELIGAEEGASVVSTHGLKYLAVRPTLSDFIVEMPRGAQVIYPKDLGAILMVADIRPGDRVLESGVGSGALSMAMLRAGAIITGYELREDFAARATANVTSFLGPEALDRYDVQLRDCYDGIDGTGFDRVVLDLPEPWRVVLAAAQALQPGGIFVAYNPSVTQVMRLREALDAAGFAMAGTLEVLHRTWHVDGQAVRPDHRMVAHTGFLTHARWLG